MKQLTTKYYWVKPFRTPSIVLIDTLEIHKVAKKLLLEHGVELKYYKNFKFTLQL